MTQINLLNLNVSLSSSSQNLRSTHIRMAASQRVQTLVHVAASKNKGLTGRFRRSERERQLLIFQRVLIVGPAAISVAWPNDQMAGLRRPAAPALPRQH
ncbi:hypothetical protein [uncultured Roseobacter sp.]|uniref:hypothetical protein n=1 Tax=uncultured Roseobacter sp. TaxID=114847 RepID=UPI002626CCFA|nr:hypothetical protein [uncultured Roseobacter sp.]